MFGLFGSISINFRAARNGCSEQNGELSFLRHWNSWFLWNEIQAGQAGTAVYFFFCHKSMTRTWVEPLEIKRRVNPLMEFDPAAIAVLLLIVLRAHVAGFNLVVKFYRIITNAGLYRISRPRNGT
jgi:hypothetical protein